MLTTVVFLLFDKNFPVKKEEIKEEDYDKMGERERVRWTRSVIS